jgi:hypothetical protein
MLFTKTGKVFPVAYQKKSQKRLPCTPACKIIGNFFGNRLKYKIGKGKMEISFVQVHVMK